MLRTVRQDRIFFFFFQAEDGIRDLTVTGVQTCALPISPFGITGLETALGLAINALHVRRGMPLARIVELLTAGPAQVLSDTAVGQRGRVSVGAPADITIFDPAAKWKYAAAATKSKSQNTPFDGWELQGRVVATVVGGRFAFRGDSQT